MTYFCALLLVYTRYLLGAVSYLCKMSISDYVRLIILFILIIMIFSGVFARYLRKFKQIFLQLDVNCIEVKPICLVLIKQHRWHCLYYIASYSISSTQLIVNIKLLVVSLHCITFQQLWHWLWRVMTVIVLITSARWSFFQHVLQHFWAWLLILILILES